jgi:hypothetical protein
VPPCAAVARIFEFGKVLVQPAHCFLRRCWQAAGRPRAPDRGRRQSGRRCRSRRQRTMNLLSLPPPS